MPNERAILRGKDDSMSYSSPRLIAFYLPQYHPIPDNDAWWGKGFTDWANVAKAEPLFPGHYQPHLPADLGFYDLRLAEARKVQAELAREYGIYGFCYYHYWFNGRRLLERPLNEVLASGEPDFPFCLCWANENWTRRWDGQDHAVLVGQDYSEEDDRAHIRWLVEAFRDPRYIRVRGRPLFLVYRTNRLPSPRRTTAIWREEAKRAGVGELFLGRVESFPDEHNDPTALGFDAAVDFQPDWGNLGEPLRRGPGWRLGRKLRLADRAYADNYIFDYARVVRRMMQRPLTPYPRFPCVMPSWDNAARRKTDARIFINSTPDAYRVWLESALAGVVDRDEEERIVFINAWNEWAEGNHLEPDLRHGRQYLEATRQALMAVKGSNGFIPKGL
jgi:lipopolysaccharide biosynthesis protein